jgi:AhpD family alkylhydroperoxidase
VAGFGQLHEESAKDGALDSKTKELIALAIGIAVHCDGCISYHGHDALEAGASREEIVEVIGVAVMMAGDPSVVYGCQALEAVDQFQSSGGGLGCQQSHRRAAGATGRVPAPAAAPDRSRPAGS